jgi:AcrR family transcriptional regulator
MSDRSSPRVRTRLSPDVRRESILDAATELFLRDGVEAGTMASVAEAAGVAKGTVYLYFDSKASLVEALKERYVEDLVAEVGALLPVGGKGSRLRRLDAFVAGLADAYEARHRLYHALFSGSSASEAPVMDSLRALLRAFVRDGVATGEFSVPDLDLATEYLLVGLHSILSLGLHSPGKAKTVPAAQRLVRRTLTG